METGNRSASSLASCLFLSQQADRIIAPIGSTVVYRCRVENGSAKALSGLKLRIRTAPELQPVDNTFQLDSAPLGVGADHLSDGLELPNLDAHTGVTFSMELVMQDPPDRNPVLVHASLLDPAEEEPLVRALPLPIWASDRCFCQCLCGQPALGKLCEGDLSTLLGLSPEDVKQIIEGLQCECPSVQKILRELGLLF